MKRGGRIIPVRVYLAAILLGLFGIQASRTEAGQGEQTPKVHGVVLDPEGTPVANAQIRILPSGQKDATSDSEGRFEAPWERPLWITGRVPYYLIARHEPRNLAAAVELLDGTETLTVRLVPGVVLSGRVTDPDGKAIADAKVVPVFRASLWGSSLNQDRTRTDRDGAFDVRALPGGAKYEISVSADGYGSIRREDINSDSATAGLLDVGALTLPPANLSVSGQVADIDRRPVPDATVSAYGDGQPERVNAQADAEGRFVLEGVCAGLVNIEATAVRTGKRLSAFVLTEGGSAGIRIVVREGNRPLVQRIGGKGYEQILATAARVIAGVAVDEKGSPVEGIPVCVRCRKAMQDGRMTWMFADFRELGATTDARGRFAIEIKEDGEYNLLFSPDKLAALVVYDIPVGKKDLVVTLPEGGTVAGRLLRIEQGRKVPIPQAEIKIEQNSRMSFSHLGFNRDRTVVTDSEGRFRVEHLSTQTRENHDKPEFVPRAWKAVYGETSQTFMFDKSELIDDFELVVRPDPSAAAPLAGKSLPGFDGVKIDLSPEQIKDKRVLVCFFDWEQRPSRSCIMQLTQQAEALDAKGVAVAAVSVSAGTDALQAWAKENRIPFPVGTIGGDRDEVLAAWSVKSLPWLILSDSGHAVKAEGFNPAELDRKLNEEPGAEP